MVLLALGGAADDQGRDGAASTSWDADIPASPQQLQIPLDLEPGELRSSDERVHPTAARFQERLHERGLDATVFMLLDSARTAPEAAVAVGGDVGRDRQVAPALCHGVVRGGDAARGVRGRTGALIAAIPGGVVLDVS